jgi:peptidoglycan L-alanyl-D-glutamate endopeptidase CwlK
MTFRFSKRSLDNLEGVHPDLVRVVKRALEISEVDFAVIDGLRTKEEQKALLNSGASRTMDSRHLTGHAVDIAPWIGGRIRWDWPPYFIMAEAMRDAALELCIAVRWGGSWSVLDNADITPEDAMIAYCNRRRAQGRVPFPDGGHFELFREEYP